MSSVNAKKAPWYKQRPLQLIVAGGFAFLILGYLTSKSPATESKLDVPQQGVQDKTVGSTTGMGSAGQTAEFNQTFASRLREEQAAIAARLEKSLLEALRKELGSEAERSKLESQRREADFASRLERLTQAQRDAQQAADRRQEADSAKGLRFKAPMASTALADVLGNGEANSTPGSTRQGLQKTADLASTASYQPVIPPNGFINGRVLNGVVATIGEAPTAFLVALEGYYKAANGSVVNLNGCNATVEGKPNLAAGRIEGKPAQITCNFGDEGRVQTWDVAGWVVDNEDGIRGLRSVLVDNSGKKITANALSSTLAAAGAMLSQSQLTNTQTAAGNSTAMTGSIGQAVAGSALGGAGTGLQQALSEYYALYKPTLQKGGGAKVTIVITNELPVPREGSYITSNVNAVEAGKK